VSDSGSKDGPGGREKRKKKIDTGSLHELATTFVYIKFSQLAIHRHTGEIYPLVGLKNQYGPDNFNQWMRSEKRTEADESQIGFDPSGKLDLVVNTFQGFETKARPGNCEPILALLRHLVGELDTIYEWVLDWIAYPLQNPGAKMPTSIIMHGDEGSGKSHFWEIVRGLYGVYGISIGQDQLEDKFNDWMSRKLFCICDEVLSRQEMRHLKGKLKQMISERRLMINAKMLPVRYEANHVNLVFLSNELQPNALDASDRRYCVIWTPPKRDDMLFYQRVAHCRDNGGLEAFYHQLLHRDLSKFDPFSPPPSTQAKRDLIDLGRSNPERWYLAWCAGDLPVPFRSCSADQAYRLYRRWCGIEGEKFPMSKNVFGRVVSRVAGDTIKHVQPKLVSLGRPVRMWMTSPPSDGTSHSAWAQDHIDAFEAELKAYTDAS
jgi:putative DNA primase/helicase